MATVFTNPIQLTVKQALDVRREPLASVSDLTGYSYTYAYDGLFVTVNNDGYPIDFTMSSNGASAPKKYHWKISSTITAPTYADLITLSETIVTTLSTTKTKSGAFIKGVKAIVLNDETKDNDWNEYIVVSVTDGVPTWEQLHVDTRKFSLQANNDDATVELVYEGVKMGEAAPLSGILEDFEAENALSGGSIVHAGDKIYLELYYGEESKKEAILVDVTELKGGSSAITDSDKIFIGTPIVYSGRVIADTTYSVTDAFNAVLDIIANNEDALKEVVNNIEILSGQTEKLSETAIKTIEDVESLEDLTPGQIVAVTAETYVYVNESGETKITQDKQEAEDNARINPETGKKDITDYPEGAYVAVTDDGIQKISTSEDAITYTNEDELY